MEIDCSASGEARVFIRPSDTEPMVKIYVEVVSDADDPHAVVALEQLVRDARGLVLRAG